MAYSQLIRRTDQRLMATTRFTASSRRGPRRRRQPNGPGVPVLPRAVLFALVLGAVGYIGYVLWPRWPGATVAPDAPALPITIAGVAFNVPPAAMRVPMQRWPGAHERVDLAFLWPSLEPPDASASPGAPAPGAPLTVTHERVFVTLAAASDKLPPTERVRIIYPHYASAVPAPGPGGLAVLAFREGTPYQGEDLIYDAEAPENFLVRCSRNGAGPTPGTCLYQLRIESADLTLRFPRDWLDDWRPLAANFDRLIASLHPPRS
jgi:hypothetical protein